MPLTTERYQKFLTNYDFFTNSVQFRIHSSKALEKWKNVQSFQLNQLVNGKFYFSQDKREILLLQYDLWSRWLYEIENLCIELAGDHLQDIVTHEAIETIIKLAQKTSDTADHIMLDLHSERFNTEFTKIWVEQHNHVLGYMIEAIRSLSELSFDCVYTQIVDIVVEVMQYTLIEIHELDTFMCKNARECNSCPSTEDCHRGKNKAEYPFIIISELAEKAFLKLGQCLVCDRLKTYRRHFKIKEIYLKNYTDEFVAPQLIERIENLGFDINYKKSLTQ